MLNNRCTSLQYYLRSAADALRRTSKAMGLRRHPGVYASIIGRVLDGPQSVSDAPQQGDARAKQRAEAARGRESVSGGADRRLGVETQAASGTMEVSMLLSPAAGAALPGKLDWSIDGASRGARASSLCSARKLASRRADARMRC